MTNFISVTDTADDELNINIDHIVLYFKSSENLKGESIIVTTYKEYQVMETPDQIDELLNRAKNN